MGSLTVIMMAAHSYLMEESLKVTLVRYRVITEEGGSTLSHLELAQYTRKRLDHKAM